MSGRIVVIGGPTASGKSALALVVARAAGGRVVNADSMQLYRDLPILTARPTADAEDGIAHALYGIWGAQERGSAGRWLSLVAPLLAQDGPLVVVGGTGLYLDALLNGIAPVPHIPPAVRAEVRALPAAQLHPALASEDPRMAARLRPSDPQRLMRALEVMRATGRSLAAWQADPRARMDLGDVPPFGLALLPPRAELHQRIEHRLDRMLAAGALTELQAFLDDPATAGSPLRKAVAVPELASCLSGAIDRDQARAAATAATRRYAKRQLTYLRHRLPAFQPIHGFGDDPDVQQQVLALLDRRPRG